MEPITYQDEQITFEAHPRRKTIRDGVRRLNKREAALKEEYSDGAEMYLHVVTYIDLTSATPTGKLIVDGEEQPWPPTYEQVVDLIPGDVVEAWGKRVYELNPDWKPEEIPTADPEQEKKAETPAG